MRDSYAIKSLEDEVFEGAEALSDLLEPDMDKDADEDMELWENPQPVKLEVTLEDGTEAEYMALGVFLEGEKEYIALETEEGDIEIMELDRGEEDDIRLIPIEDKKEQEQVIEAFRYYFEEPENGSEAENESEADPEAWTESEADPEAADRE